MTGNGVVHPMARAMEPQLAELGRRLAELNREYEVAKELVAEWSKAGNEARPLVRAMQGQVGVILSQMAKVSIQVRLLEKQLGREPGQSVVTGG